MNTKNTILLGASLSVLGLFFSSFILEGGDINTIGLIIILFTIPSIIPSVLNGYYLEFVENLSNSGMQKVLSFLPVVLFLLLALPNNIPLPIIDINLSFVFKLAVIPLFITNMVWLYKLEKT
ncbi:MAG: hypothetical protein ABJH08_02125 [Balneola sp.]